jgi:hypothetical protein
MCLRSNSYLQLVAGSNIAIRQVGFAHAANGCVKYLAERLAEDFNLTNPGGEEQNKRG